MRTMWLRRLFPVAPLAARPRPANSRPCLELLEDRLTPSHTVAIVDAPAVSAEGTAIALTSSVVGATTPTYAWSVTKDGAAFDTGTPTTNADFSFTPDDNASYIVSLAVTDDDGTGVHVVSASSTIAVDNVAPTAGITGAASGVPGQLLNFTVTATDPSTVDAEAGFTYKIDWESDGTVDETIAASDGNGAGVAVSHTFTTTGTFQVSVTATDKDGDVSAPETLSVTISRTAVVDGTLFVGGTEGNDNISIIPKGKPKSADATVKLLMNGTKQVFTGIDEIQVFALGGNDRVHLAGAIRVPAMLDGGDGNDNLKGGKGADLLLGRDGNDHLNGQQNNDVLIGGAGLDRLIGGPGEDLLIAGSLTFDEDPEALAALWAAWSASTPIGARVAALTNPTAAVALIFEGANATVVSDGDADRLTGAARTDWFVATPGEDTITDLHGNEFLNGGKATGKGKGKG